MPRVHLVSLPHTQTTSEYLTCAYTQKLVKFCKMMKPLGYEVILYAGEENEADSFEHVPLVTKEECERWFGKHDIGRIYPITWDPNDVHWRTMNRRAVRAIREYRATEQDLVLLIGGNCQRQIADDLPEMLACEWGCGYEGFFADAVAFESAAWRHYLYGRQGYVDGRWYDTVIPNFFDPEDFYTGTKDDYLLYIGRIVMRKGVHVAAQLAERVGRRLLVAGAGVSHVEPGLIFGDGITIRGDHVEYVGALGREERARMMAGAVATLVPTLYIEPFGGVAVESMLSGTPVVTSDWGAFVETVEPGLTGERFGTLSEGAAAIERVSVLGPEAIRARAVERFGIGSVAPMYDAWFERVLTLWRSGWAE